MPLMRSAKRLAVALATLVGLNQGHSAEAGVSILIQSSPLAGSQYYALTEVWPQMAVGDRLELYREADNRHDRRAVRVEWRGRQLGYVPRAENRAVAAALDAGEPLRAHIAKLRDEPDPWRKLEFEVWLPLP